MLNRSRSELLAWLNDLLQLSYNKVEQCGSGAVCKGFSFRALLQSTVPHCLEYIDCQILDSIYQDLPMSKVKFAAKQEFEYVNNYKILQQALKKHKVDKPVPVEMLMKCKMQDNLEFLQWLKKFWDANFPGGDYDATGRRKGVAGDSVSSSATAPTRTTSARAPVTAPKRAPVSSSSGIGNSASTQPRANRAAAPNVTKATSSARASPSVAALTEEIAEMKLGVEGLEKERDFYYTKLRDIEIMVAARLEDESQELPASEEEILKSIQAILYATEEGFEAPVEEGEEEEENGEEELF